MKKILTLSITLYLCCLTTQKLFADGGEDCPTAVVIASLPFCDVGSTVGAIDNYTDCGFNTSPDEVYSYTPSVNEIINITLCPNACGSTDYDSRLAVYNSSSCTTNIACNDDACGLQSSLPPLAVTAGTTYFIVVDGYTNNSGNYAISVSVAPPAPANDDCSGAVPVALTNGVPVTEYGDNTGATPDCGYYTYPTVWHAVTVSGACTDLTVSYCGNPITGPGGSGAQGNTWIIINPACPLACYGDIFNSGYDNATCGDGNWSVYYNNLAPGTYYIPVMGEYAGYNIPGPYQVTFLAIDCPPPYDPCANIVDVICDIPTSTSWTTGDGSFWGANICGYNDLGEEHLFTYTPTSTGVYNLNITIHNGGFVDWMYKDASLGCDQYNWICFSGGGVIGPTTLTIGNLNAGTTYYLWADKETLSPGDETFEISCTPCVAPVNDDCSGAVPVTLTNGIPVTEYGTTECATPDGGYYTEPTVWHAVTLTGACNNLTVDWCGTAPGIMSGNSWIIINPSCPLTPYGDTFASSYDNTTCGDGNWTIRYNGLAPGTWYVGVLGSLGNVQGPYTITMLSVDCPPPPPNDDCSAAVPVVLTSGLPVTEFGDHTGATPDCGYYTYPTVWHAVTLPTCMDLTVAFCGSGFGAAGNAWIIINPTCPITCYGDIFATSFENTSCGDGNWSIYYNNLAAGTYWIPILGEYPGYNTPGPYQVTFTGYDCGPQYDPCANIVDVICDIPTSTSWTTGDGSPWGPNVCGYNDLGEEHLFTFTPALTGVYNLNITVHNGGFVDWMYKDASLGCDQYNWICISGGGVIGPTTLTIGNLNAGTTYYLWADKETLAPGDETFNIPCGPCVAPVNDDCSGAVPVTLVNGIPVTEFGTTECATPDGGYYTEPTVWHAVTLTAACNNLTVDWCGTAPGIMSGNSWIIINPSCPLTPFGDTFASSYDNTTCGDGNWTIRYNGLAPGTWYVGVLGSLGNVQGPYTITMMSVDCPPPPPNDDCTGAVPVVLVNSIPVTEFGDNTGATPDCGYYSMPTVWHAVTLPNCMDLKVSYCANDPARFGDVWIIMNPTCPLSCYGDIFASSYENTSCGDGNWSVYWNNLAAGTYYIPILSEEPGWNTPGPYQVTFTGTNCPGIYDPCANVVAVSCGVSTSTNWGTNGGAWGINGCGLTDLGEEHLFTFTPAISSAYYLDITSHSGTNVDWSYKDASSGCNPNGWTCISSGINAPTSLLIGNLTGGTTYYLWADKADLTSGSETFNIPCCNIPANDVCAGATPVLLISGVPVTQFGTTLCATSDGGNYSEPTVWHAVTLGACMDLTINWCGTAPGVLNNVWTMINPTCPLTPFGDISATNFNNTSCGDGNYTVNYLGLPSGTYYVGVHGGAGNNPGAYTINLSAIDCPMPPVNDLPCNAIDVSDVFSQIHWSDDFITCIDVMGNNVAGTVDIGEPASVCGTGFNHTIWYSFTAPVCGVFNYTITTDNTGTDICGGLSCRDTQLQLFHSLNGTCDYTQFSLVGCSDDNAHGDCDDASSVLYSSTISDRPWVDPFAGNTSANGGSMLLGGETYFIQVDGSAGSVGDIVLSVSIETDAFTPVLALGSPSPSTIIATWNNTGANNYDLYLFEIGQPGYAQALNQTSFTKTWVGLPSNTDFGVQVKYACEAYGTDNYFSPIEEITTDINTCPPFSSGPTCEVITSNSISVGWTAVPGALYYKSFKQKVGNNGYTVHNNITGLNDVWTGLTPNTDYNFWVKAVCYPQGGNLNPNSPITMCTTLPSMRLGDLDEKDTEDINEFDFDGAHYVDWNINRLNLDLPDNVSEVDVVDGQIVFMDYNGNNVSQLSEQNDLFRIYPNPANNLATLDIMLEASGEVTIQVYDIQNKLVKSVLFNAENLHAVYSLSLDEMPSGIYNVVLKTSSQTLIQKLAVVK